MRFGPSSLRATRVLAKGLRRPKFRSGLRISKQNIAGETSYVVKIEETNSYRRYGEFEFELLSACDGTRTPAELAAYMTAQHADQPLDEAEVLEFLDGVEPEMWERSVGEKNLAILERLRDERKGRLDQSSLLYLTFKAWDPNKTLARLDPWLGWMYTRGFVVFSMLLFIVTLAILSRDWARIEQDTLDLWHFTDKSAFDIGTLWILILVMGGIHEFGHGLTCKHYGGDVHQMGFMLIYFTPAFYTDTTDILLMDRIAPRQWTIFAGIWVELTVCGVSALIWHFALPGSFAGDIAYKMMLLSGVQGALLNLNPLIKADGYYALCQYLQVDNLREDAFAYLKAWFLKYVLRRDVELPAASRRVRRIFLAFSLAAITYSTALILFGFLWAKNMCVAKFGLWGYVVFGGVIYFLARKKLGKFVPSAREWIGRKKEALMAWKITRTQTIGFAAAALLIALPPVPSSVSAGFILEPGQQADVRATVPGEIQQVFVRLGDTVQAGQLIARLENPELETNAAVETQQFALAEASLRAAEASANPAAIAAAGREATKDEQDMRVAKEKAAQLEMRAPIAGIITTPELTETAGMHFREGQVFCHVSNRTDMRARILVRDWEMPDVHAGAQISLKVTTYPMRTYSGRIERILPATATDQPVSDPVRLTRNGQDLTNYVAVVADFPNFGGMLREGMTGTAKIFSAPRPLVWQWGRGAWRWFRSQVW